MTPHDALVILNSGIRVAIGLVVAWQMLCRFHGMNHPERLGLAIIGGASLLTIPPMAQEEMTPFDDWASVFFAAGLLLYLIGLVRRGCAKRQGEGTG